METIVSDPGRHSEEIAQAPDRLIARTEMAGARSGVDRTITTAKATATRGDTKSTKTTTPRNSVAHIATRSAQKYQDATAVAHHIAHQQRCRQVKQALAQKSRDVQARRLLHTASLSPLLVMVRPMLNQPILEQNSRRQSQLQWLRQGWSPSPKQRLDTILI